MRIAMLVVWVGGSVILVAWMMKLMTRKLPVSPRGFAVCFLVGLLAGGALSVVGVSILSTPNWTLVASMAAIFASVILQSTLDVYDAFHHQER